MNIHTLDITIRKDIHSVITTTIKNEEVIEKEKKSIVATSNSHDRIGSDTHNWSGSTG